MAPTSSQVPGYDPTKRTTAQGSSVVSGRTEPGDPTNEPGQYPVGGWGNAIFGGQLPDGTGAPGSAGARGTAGADPTNEPGQTEDGLTGISEHDITATGAPGSEGGVANLGGGPDSVTFTRPGSYQSGSYASDTVRDAVSGPTDWTGANDSGYGTDGPKLPGMQEPVAGEGRFQPGGGSVMRGGRAVRG